MKIQANAYVVVDYALVTDSGEILDDSTAEGSKPIRYVHGYGMLVPGLEARLAGLGTGDKNELIVPAAEAYGEHDEELCYELDRAEVDGDVEEGDEIILEDDGGEEAAVYVVEVRDDGIVVDGNHPLAGADLRYRVHVREVREATVEEIARAAADFDSAAPHEHGPDCAHEHEAPLMSVGRKKPDLSS